MNLTIKRMKQISYIIITVGFVAGIFSCKKFIDVPPPIDKLIGATVFQSNATASSAVNGIFTSMVTTSIAGGLNGPSILLGLSADELKLFPNSNQLLNETYANSLKSINAATLWGDYYSCIYQANAAILSLNSSSNVSESLKKQLLGEAKVARAYCYFNLINIYGDVPLILGTDYQANSQVAKSGIQEIYLRIKQDLIGEKFVNRQLFNI